MNEKIALGDFITRMKDGAGWWNSEIPCRIGKTLAAVVPPEHYRTPVVVAYKTGHYGSGPDFHYTYQWRVAGYTLPQEGRPGPDRTQLLFGSGGTPDFRNDGDGFIIRAEW